MKGPAPGDNPHAPRATPEKHVLEPPEVYFRSYTVELLYPLPPQPFDEAFDVLLRQALAEVTSGTVEVGSSAAGAAGKESGDRPELRMVYTGDTGDSGEPPEWHLERVDQPPANLASAVGQSWWWQSGRRLAPEVRGAIRISDHRDSTLDGLQRVRRFRRVVSAVEIARPSLAILWTPSQQLVDPRELLSSVKEHPLDPLPGPINVRYFKTAGSQPSQSGPDRDDTFLMDTLGLGALGLTDLQCHFRGLDPDSVSQVLFETALYLLDRSAVLGDGHTVQGPGERDRWVVRRKPALAEPIRDVLDLDPGFPFASA